MNGICDDAIVYLFQGGAPDKIQYEFACTGYITKLVDVSAEERVIKELVDIEDIDKTNRYVVFCSENQTLKYPLMYGKMISSSHYIFPKFYDINVNDSTYQFDTDKYMEKMTKFNLAYIDPKYTLPTDYWFKGRLINAALNNYDHVIIKPVKESGNRGIMLRDINNDNHGLPFEVSNEDLETLLSTRYKDVDCAIQPIVSNEGMLNIDFVVKDGKLFDYVIHRKVGKELYARWVNGLIDHSDGLWQKVEELLNAIISGLKIKSGLINPELIVDENGDLKLLEVNMRYSTTMGIPKDLTENRVDLIHQLLDVDYENEYGEKFSDIFKGCSKMYKRYENTKFFDDIPNYIR